jgi:hypothetical protein
MSDDEALLAQYQPELHYDSNEAFFADSPREWTDNPGNELRRASNGDGVAETLARAGGQPPLSLDMLGWPQYRGGEAAREDDTIAVPRRRDYRDMYVALRQHKELRDHMYGRVAEATDRVWLQYWFFYFYNDYHLAGDLGLHEGDWEMVQFRLDGDKPDLAVYAQHRQAQAEAWEDIKRQGDTPLVYVARGSHASYFKPGYHETEAWYDIADGRGRTVRPQLHVVSPNPPGWLQWRGIWGGTRARIRDLEQPSPDAPCRHKQWEHPASLLKDARDVITKPPPGAPQASIKRRPAGAQITFSMPADTAAPAESLILTLRSEQDDRTFTYTIYGVLDGQFRTSISLEPQWRYDAFISSTDTHGNPSASCHVPLESPQPRPPLQKILSWIASLSRRAAQTRRRHTGSE